MPIDSAEKRPYYVLIETNNAPEGKTMKIIVKVPFFGGISEMSVAMMRGCDYRPLLELEDGSPFVAVKFV